MQRGQQHKIICAGRGYPLTLQYFRLRSSIGPNLARRVSLLAGAEKNHNSSASGSLIDTRPSRAPSGQRQTIFMVRKKGDEMYGATACIITAHFAAFTYVEPLLITLQGVPATALSGLLLLSGISGLVGNVIAGKHIDQTNESDGSFLMRLARQYGAIASVKNGNLLFIRQGQGKSASGKPLPVITITRKDGDSHRFTLADRGAYTGVIASWLHTREPAKKESTTVKRKRRTKKQKKEPEAKQGDYLVGTDENVLVLNRTYANRSNAERAAKMQWERLQRGVASFSLQLAEGRADLYTEMPVKVSGFKQPIDDAEWTITTLTHTVSPDNGFTTSLELEVRIDDFEME